MISIRSLCIVVATCLSLPAWATDSAPVAATPAVAPAPAADAAVKVEPPAKPADAAATKGKNDPTERLPGGYKVKVIGGETRYCRKSTPLGTRFPSEVCLTEAQYMSVRNQNELRQELTGKQKSYSISN